MDTYTYDGFQWSSEGIIIMYVLGWHSFLFLKL